MNPVTVIGAGLAGCEAAWQLAERGVPVRLLEMKPVKMTPAHHSDNLAELVCSNSLRSNELSNAAGLLKEELRRLGGREAFAGLVTERVTSHPLVELTHGEVAEIPRSGPVIVATGPLTSDALFEDIHRLVGGEFLHFYDAAAPIVTAASRYGKGTADYINCAMDRAQFDAFWEALTSAEQAEVHGFEDKLVFEGCMPIEVNARRGHDTLLYGILKPIGLPDPKTGKDPYAVLQLRRDNAQGSLYNLVGCQTHLKFGEQKRVFSMIPALRDAEFVRYGVMHRNTFLDSPRLLDSTYALKSDPRIRFAGQMTGVEGYVESNASGYLAGVCAACEALGRPLPTFPTTTAVGALAAYISNQTVTKFQPMNINFGIIDPLGYRVRGKREKNQAISARALEVVDSIAKELA